MIEIERDREQQSRESYSTVLSFIVGERERLCVIEKEKDEGWKETERSKAGRLVPDLSQL